MKSELKNKLSLVGFRPLAFLAVFPFLACGCASIDPARMVPELQPRSEWKVSSSVKVMEVTSVQKSTFDGVSSNSMLANNDMLVNEEQFKKALILALEKSGLFSAVSIDKGDLDLYASIRSQDLSGLGYNTVKIVVSYKFIDRAGNVIWLESYESEFGSVAFAAKTTHVRAREGSVRENLSSLMQGIRERWPKK